eukprot:s2486_g7.t1
MFVLRRIWHCLLMLRKAVKSIGARATPEVGAIPTGSGYGMIVKNWEIDYQELLRAFAVSVRCRYGFDGKARRRAFAVSVRCRYGFDGKARRWQPVSVRVHGPRTGEKDGKGETTSTLQDFPTSSLAVNGAISA